METQKNSSTITEQAHLVQTTKTESSQYHIIRLELPQIAQQATAGMQIKIDNIFLPVIRTYPDKNNVDVLCSGDLPDWANHNQQNKITVFVKSEKSFQISTQPHKALLIGKNMGIAPIIFLAEQLKGRTNIWPLMLLEFSGNMPFRPRPSQIMIPTLPNGVIATLSILEDWLVPCRIAHNNGLPGCYDGNVIDLAEYWLKQQQTLEQVSIYACGRNKMIKSASKLAQRFSVPCQTVEID